MDSIRETFHSLGNSHNMLTLGVGVTKELIEECLEQEKSLTPESREKLSEISKNLELIIKSAKEADAKTRDIQEWVYKLIDPDTGKAR